MLKSIMQNIAAAKPALAPITGAELAGIIGRDDVLVVDVREPHELARTGTVPGAINVPHGMLEVHADDRKPTHDAAFSRDKTVVLFCASGVRAALAGRRLSELGFNDVRVLGTLKAWIEAGGRIERG